MIRKGVILPDKDEENKGLYLVYIPEMMGSMETSKGMWCRNGIATNRISSSNDKGIYGQYYPLYAGTKVEVEVSENDKTIGVIKNIISDSLKDSLPLNYDTENRDEITQVFRTPNNLFIICEDTVEGTEKPLDKNRPQSIHIYYKDKSYKFILDDNGVHNYVDNHYYCTITKDSELKIPNLTINVTKIKVKGDLDVDGTVKVSGDVHCSNVSCESTVSCNYVDTKDISQTADATGNDSNGDSHSLTVNFSYSGSPGSKGESIEIPEKFAYDHQDKKELDFSFEEKDTYGITKIVKDGLKK